jgi:hypothetical protein
MKMLQYRILSAVNYDMVIQDKITSDPNSVIRWRHEPGDAGSPSNGSICWCGYALLYALISLASAERCSVARRCTPDGILPATPRGVVHGARYNSYRWCVQERQIQLFQRPNSHQQPRKQGIRTAPHTPAARTAPTSNTRLCLPQCDFHISAAAYNWSNPSLAAWFIKDVVAPTLVHADGIWLDGIGE